jgi:diaminopimelate decarboxylase
VVELRPVKHPLVQSFVRDNKRLLDEMLGGYSSPLHIIFPQVFAENVNRFRSVLSRHRLEDNIFFACKANKSDAFIETACYMGIGVEVSSYYELQNSLGRGIQGAKMIASGPGKTLKYLLLAMRCGATISIDSEMELANVIRLSKKSSMKPRIFLRIGNVVHKSRFGIDTPISNEIIRMLASSQNAVEIVGFAGHLSSYNLEERPKLIKKFMRLCEKFRRLGYLNCNTIDIGGGFPISYTTGEAWKNFDARKEEFWNNRAFRHFYPCYSEFSGSDGLKHILDHMEGGKRLSELLKEGGHKLVIEPGQGLLDQAGITVMRITDVKEREQGQLVVVDGNNDHLSERLFDTDFLVSPELLSFGRRGMPFDGYVAGNTCMREDMLLWHKTKFDTAPVTGDMLVFYNTAAYYMDSNESDFSRMPIPAKICAIMKHGGWKTYDDESFNQVEFLDRSV